MTQAAQVAPAAAASASASTAACATPAMHGGVDLTSPPRDVRAMERKLSGLQRAQIHNRTEAREVEIGELDFDLGERRRKFQKYGHWRE
mmetsp:Transcript_59348/g.157463  ORF Transcript_59348/g.157463 Transcript_59348/m.157463 type:complete len:89 (+) Transcript_59348:1-267(+)